MAGFLNIPSLSTIQPLWVFDMIVFFIILVMSFTFRSGISQLKKHIASLAHLEKEDEALVGRIYGVINKIAEELGFKEKGFKVVVNCGEDGGQEVMHLHFHILAGENLRKKFV